MRLLPRVETPRGDEYLDVLDRALVDRHLSVEEHEELLDVARALGLGLLEVLGLHREYLTALGEAAREDGVVTADEEADLRLVASLLGVDVVPRRSGRLSSRAASSPAMPAKSGARRASAALKPCTCWAPRSRRGLTSVHHSSVRRPDPSTWTTATSITRWWWPGESPVVSTSTTA
ncbi:hypothetical protein C8D88_12235 [Lentzea atacamensis]|uniref:Tellurite resistance protein TerB n=1 Tax=Lentzea atacamensis TaxID=531938 RepID=A0A316HKE2_9PSEU|nr:hypothetical protein C8D88_12235 [Lentzea atacamensis]